MWEPFSQRFGSPPRTLMVEAPGGSWKPIPSTLWASYPQFVAPYLLYFHRYSTISHPGKSGAFLMRTNSGEVSRLQVPHEGWCCGQAAVSRDGNRFVILLLQDKGFHPALDMGGHSQLKGLLVFDPPFRVPSYTLQVQGSKLRNPDLVALSPDGRHFAVLGYPRPVLEMFDLPLPK